MAPERCNRFKDISVSEKVLNTIFLLTIGMGYLMALVNTYYTHEGLDGRPGLTIEDIVISYHGKSDQTRLGTAINGIMKNNLRHASDKQVIMDWIKKGADEESYNAKIRPILDSDCVFCHNPETNPTLPNLTEYSTVSEVAHSGGASLPRLVQVSHVQLFGIAFILFFIGKIFLLCDMNPHIKRIAVVIPFLSMLVDVVSWFITKTTPSFAYVVVFSGALMGLSMGLQILLSIYQMWFYSKNEDNL